MASATVGLAADEWKIPTAGIKFMGPAQQEFDSLNEQATYFLNTYWPNWNNYTEPQSYILPPVFKFKHPEVSDEAFEKFLTSQASTKPSNPHEVITERNSDEAEYLVYNAIQQLIRDDVQAPFIAIHNLDLRLNYDANKKLHGSLTKLFPDFQWNKFQDILKKALSKETPNAEFDFVLIGPKFGIVVIEVKSSCFKQDKHFKEKIRFLPDDYKHGLAQLQAVNALVYLLQEATGIPVPGDSCVRKFIFTPNLAKARFDKWVSALDVNGQTYLNKKINDTVQWFQEDVEFLSDRLRGFLQSGTKMSTVTYEAYCPILAAIASITLLSSADGSSVTEMDKLDFSTLEASLKEHSRILDQNPFGNQASKLAACSQLIRAPKQIKDFLKVIFLTPDQQKALQGPRRQFILGPAGTGKTIVLQAKALECLQNGESVVVLAQKCYVEWYKALFKNYNFKNFEVYDQEDISYYFMNNIINFTNLNLFNNVSDIVKQYREEFVKREVQEKMLFNSLFMSMMNFNNVFIDDTMDADRTARRWWCVHRSSWAFIIIVIMELAQRDCPSKIVWAATDPLFSSVKDTFDQFLDNGIHSSYEIKKECFDQIELKQVMRCSENIFNAAFSRNVVNGSEFLPMLGHKVQGLGVRSVKGHFSTFVEAKTALWEKIKIFLDQFSQQTDFDLSGLAIIVYYEVKHNHEIHNFLARQCLQEFPHLQSNSRIDETDSSFFKTCLVFTIRDWSDVSSLEWPAIILAGIANSKSNREYQKYRAMSRATAILIDISITHNENMLTINDTFNAIRDRLTTTGGK